MLVYGARPEWVRISRLREGAAFRLWAQASLWLPSNPLLLRELSQPVRKESMGKGAHTVNDPGAGVPRYFFGPFPTLSWKGGSISLKGMAWGFI